MASNFIHKKIIQPKLWALIFLVGALAACSAPAWKEDPAVQAASQACQGLPEMERYACYERQAVANLNPEVCRLAGMWIDDTCLQAVYEAAGDPSICDRIYLPGVVPNCRAYYERLTPQAAATLPAASSPSPIPSPSPASTSPPPAATPPLALETVTHTATPAPTAAVVVSQGSGPLYETILSIPVGGEGVHYEGVGRPEMYAWGPAGFTVSGDSSFWIADSVRTRLLHYAPDGSQLGGINLTVQVVGITDLECRGSELVLLDGSDPKPKVLRLSMQGELLARYELPRGMWLEDGLSGIAIGEGEEILVELMGGAQLRQLTDTQGNVHLAHLEGYTYGGRLFRSQGVSAEGGQVQAGSPQAIDLGGLRLLAVLPDGSFVLVREEVVSSSPLMIDQTVRYYSQSVDLLGIARFPLAEQFLYVEHNLAAGPDGNVYGLITRPASADIVRLIFYEQIEPLSPN